MQIIAQGRSNLWFCRRQIARDLAATPPVKSNWPQCHGTGRALVQLERGVPRCDLMPPSIQDSDKCLVGMETGGRWAVPGELTS
jgi:hypothetical protein